MPRPPLDAIRWRKLKQLFETAKDLPELERAEFVAGEDPETTAHLERLLAADDERGSMLDRPVPERLTELSRRDGVEAPPETDFRGKRLCTRYLLEEEIGRGGSSVVWRARDERLQGRTVVVKILVRNALSETDWLEVFESEAQALSRIDHPGVARPLDAGVTDDGLPILILEHVAGRTLRAEMESGPLEASRAMRLAGQMARALERVHEAGVWHLDLKPENVIIRNPGTKDEQAVILDFGVSRVRNRGTGLEGGGGIVGSPQYMAPEQFEGRASPASDIYTLGLIAREMLSGRQPEEGIGLRGIPTWARLAIARALREKPGERYGSAAEFAAAVERLPGARRKWRGIAAALCVMAAGATWWQVWTARRTVEDRREEFRVLTENTATVGNMVHRSVMPGKFTTDLLENSIHRMREIVAQEGNRDPGLREDLARALMAQGSALGDPEWRNMGRTQRAMEVMREAVAEADKAAAMAPRRWEARVLAAEARARLASILVELGDVETAGLVVGEGLAAVGEPGESAAGYRELAGMRMALLVQQSRIYCQRKEYGECLRLRHQLVEARRRIDAQERHSADSSRYLGGALALLGDVLAAMGRGREALREFEESDGIFGRLRRLDAEDAHYEWVLARNALEEGRALLQSGERGEAQTKLWKAIAFYERQHAEDATSRRALALCKAYLAEAEPGRRGELIRDALALAEGSMRADPGNAKAREEYELIRSLAGGRRRN